MQYWRLGISICAAVVLSSGAHLRGGSSGNTEVFPVWPGIIAHANEQSKRKAAPIWLPSRSDNNILRKLTPALESELGNLVGVPESQKARAMPADGDHQACSFGVFVDGLISSDMFLWMKEHKEELEFLPPDEFRRNEQNERFRLKKLHARRFFAGLMDLNATSRTFALVFGSDTVPTKNGEDYRRYNCVWLADQTGIRARGVSVSAQTIDDNLLWMELWPDLRVDARSAARAPRKREAGETCDLSQSDPVSNEELGRIHVALKRIGEQLIPVEISRVLQQEDSGDARLYVVPTASVQKVPFAALPLGNGYLIDKFAIMIAPASDVIGNLSDAEITQSVLPKPSSEAVRGSEVLVVGNPDLS